MANDENSTIDETSLKEILRILEKDARTTAEQIAAMVDKPVEDVRRAIEEAEKSGLILRYKAMVNWDKFGDDQLMAMVEIKVTPQRGVGFDAIAKRVYRFPEARTVYLVSGTYDLAVLVAGNSIKDVATFVTEKISTLEFVQSTVTHFLLKRYKVDGEILEPEEKTERLLIAP